MKSFTITKTITLDQSESVEAYLRDIKRFRPLSREMELATLRLAQAGCAASRDKIINHNLRFVVSSAKRYQHTGPQMQLMDLIQLGNLGLIHAVERYDLNSGMKFITFAVWWIRKFIMAEMDKYSAPIKYPYNFYAASAKIRDLKGKFEQTHGHEPASEELLEAVLEAETPQTGALLSETDRRVLDYGELYTNRFVYLDGPSKLNHYMDDVVLLDTLPDESQAPSDHLTREADQQLVLERLLGTLGEREGAIVRASFGLSGEDAESVDSLAKRYGITTVRIRHILASAVKKMQRLAAELNYHPDNNND